MSDVPARKLELRKISYNKALSEETSAYAADLYVDGVLLCHVSNHGHGGCDMQHPAKGKTHADVAELDAFIKATYPKRDIGLVFGERSIIVEEDIESICGTLLDQHLASKDLQRLLKRTVAFYDPATKQIQNYKGTHVGEGRAHLITETLRKNPGVKILNNLPFDEALALYRSAA